MIELIKDSSTFPMAGELGTGQGQIPHLSLPPPPKKEFPAVSTGWVAQGKLSLKGWCPGRW